MSKTRGIEMYLGWPGGTWTTIWVDIPADTPEAAIEKVACETLEFELNRTGQAVCFFGVYWIPEPDTDPCWDKEKES